jgi:hypothetical protein
VTRTVEDERGQLPPSPAIVLPELELVVPLLDVLPLELVAPDEPAEPEPELPLDPLVP